MQFYLLRFSQNSDIGFYESVKGKWKMQEGNKDSGNLDLGSPVSEVPGLSVPASSERKEANKTEELKQHLMGC